MDDLISRKAVLDALREPHPMDYNACATVHIVQSIPAVDAVPVAHGRDISDSQKYHCEFKCSICGADAMSVAYGTLDGGCFNYCPNCGAKMDEHPEPPKE